MKIGFEAPKKDKPRRTIAVDFDGTLFTDAYPNIGRPIECTIKAAKAEQEAGAQLILWTTRTGKQLAEAVAACKAQGLHFDAVNDSCDDWKEYYGTDPRKVGASEYWDDKARNLEAFNI